MQPKRMIIQLLNKKSHTPDHNKKKKKKRGINKYTKFHFSRKEWVLECLPPYCSCRMAKSIKGFFSTSPTHSLPLLRRRRRSIPSAFISGFFIFLSLKGRERYNFYAFLPYGKKAINLAKERVKFLPGIAGK